MPECSGSGYVLGFGLTGTDFFDGVAECPAAGVLGADPEACTARPAIPPRAAAVSPETRVPALIATGVLRSGCALAPVDGSSRADHRRGRTDPARTLVPC